MDVLSGSRDIEAFVAAKVRQSARGMVAVGTGVDLHDESIIKAHARHFRQHLTAKCVRLL